MDSILIFDADNTLWDTNGVFRSAQLALLEEFAQAALIDDPEEQFLLLRKVDQQLILRLGVAEYPIRYLAAALAYHFAKNMPIDEAVDEAITQSGASEERRLALLIERATQAFDSGLRMIPDLYPDTTAVLGRVCDHNRRVSLVFSEGDPERLERIFQAHAIRRSNLFDEIVIGPKSTEAFIDAMNAGLALVRRKGCSNNPLVVLIGDSLHRDIKHGNQAGITTIYKPSPYKGVETPVEDDEHPDITITSLSDLPAALETLGIHV